MEYLILYVSRTVEGYLHLDASLARMFMTLNDNPSSMP